MEKLVTAKESADHGIGLIAQRIPDNILSPDNKQAVDHRFFEWVKGEKDFHVRGLGIQEVQCSTQNQNVSLSIEHLDSGIGPFWP